MRNNSMTSAKPLCFKVDSVGILFTNLFWPQLWIKSKVVGGRLSPEDDCHGGVSGGRRTLPKSKPISVSLPVITIPEVCSLEARPTLESGLIQDDTKYLVTLVPPGHWPHAPSNTYQNPDLVPLGLSLEVSRWPSFRSYS